MGYVKSEVANAVAKKMAEKYGIKHIAVHNDATNMDIVMIASAVIKKYGSIPTSVYEVYP